MARSSASSIAAGSSPRSRERNSQSKGLGSTYLEESKRPLPSLVFLLPLIVAYEVGTLIFARNPLTGTETRIIAFRWLGDFLALFGATGRFLPALAVVVILLAVHLFENDRWEFRPSTLGWMAVESVAWAFPLIALALLATQHIPMVGVALSERESLPALIVLSLGAGIYEELVFRLAAFALFSFVLTDVLGVNPVKTGWITVLTTAVGFSLYHYLGSESWHLRTFVFRAMAGAFFGALYLWRGFGVTAGSHAAYDVIVHLLGRG